MSITLIIIIGTGILSWRAFNDVSIFERFLYSPFQVNHQQQWYRVFTHALIHGSWMHLIFNMWWLWIFGRTVEDFFSLEVYFGDLGRFLFLVLYIGGIAFAALPGFVKHRDNHLYRSIGASGAVAAVLFAFIIMAPTYTMHFFFLPPMPAWVFGLGYLALEYYLDKRGRDNVAHDAHFWGAVFGAGFVIALKPELAVQFVEQVIGPIL